MADLPYLIALDVAGRTGVAEGWALGVPRLYSIQFRKAENDARVTIAFGRAVAWAANRFSDEPRPDMIYVEGLVPDHAVMGQRTDQSRLIQVGLYGAIAGVAEARDIVIVPVSIARVRTHILGRSHGLKGEEAKKRVKRECEQMGWTPANLDESDAAAVFHWAASQHANPLL